jgi:hypothetical protein
LFSFICDRFENDSFFINCNDIVDDILRRPEVDEKILKSYFDLSFLKLHVYPILAFDDVDRFHEIDHMWNSFLDWILNSESKIILMSFTSLEKINKYSTNIFDHSNIFSLPQLKAVDRERFLSSFTKNVWLDDSLDLQMIANVEENIIYSFFNFWL